MDSLRRVTDSVQIWHNVKRVWAHACVFNSFTLIYHCLNLISSEFNTECVTKFEENYACAYSSS